MSALELKDITNLPTSLPYSVIPQPQPEGGGYSKHAVAMSSHGLQQQLAMQNSGKHMDIPHEQRRMMSFNDSGCCELMDDSLTDMQWLQRMDAGSDFPGLTHAQRQKKLASKARTMSKDGCRKKLDYTSKKGSNKPPLSYASLIALAICSTPQRMMTLSSIYRWIEYTFPFYRTPQAKAWKNSIRHNLSIRKNMFMKVFQYPPRRGNGSYWTLLSDGEEELKKAVPLFATLQPPVIDSNCAYHREPSTHTVKSKGKFVPVLPRSNHSSAGGLPYFSVAPTSLASGVKMSATPDMGASGEIVIGESSGDIDPSLTDEDEFGHGERLGKHARHLSDHSYARSSQAKLGNMASETETVELAVGESTTSDDKVSGWDDGIQDFSDPSTPKRRRKLGGVGKGKASSTLTCLTAANEGGSSDIVIPKPKVLITSPGSSPSFTTPPKEDQNNSSLHLLDSSFLTPLKNMAVPDVEIGAISFSPLYANLVTTPKQVLNRKFSDLSSSSDIQAHHQYFSSPLTPLKTSLDSGIFSPLRSDCLGGMKFSTPTSLNSLSPLADLSSFSSLQPELYPLKVLNTSGSAGSTPLRPGSLHALGLPGLTPPSEK